MKPKAILLTFLFFLLVLPTFAGPLISNSGYILHGYGGPQFKLTWLRGAPCMFGGGPLMVFPMKNCGTGIIINYLEADVDGVQVIYGGVRVEGVLAPDFLLSPSFALTLGGGGYFPALTAYENNAGTTRSKEVSSDNSEIEGSGGFFILEPEVNISLGILPDLQLSVGGSYRLAIGPFGVGRDGSRTGASPFAWSAPSINIHLREGHFEDSASIFYNKPRFPQFHAQERRKREKPPFIIGGFYDSTFTWFSSRFARLDGGGTRFIIKERFALGASGRFLASPVIIDEKQFTTMESGLWAEWFFNPGGTVLFSIGGLTGVGMYGWMVSATEVSGGPAFLVNPELLCSCFITDFIQIGVGLGYRFVFGTALKGYSDSDFWGPTAAVQVRFGGF
jgi:hypothetical protein